LLLLQITNDNKLSFLHQENIQTAMQANADLRGKWELCQVFGKEGATKRNMGQTAGCLPILKTKWSLPPALYKRLIYKRLTQARAI
jgi:hypothetical protein